MAEIRTKLIVELPVAQVYNGTEIFPIQQDGATRKTTSLDIIDYTKIQDYATWVYKASSNLLTKSLTSGYITMIVDPENDNDKPEFFIGESSFSQNLELTGLSGFKFFYDEIKDNFVFVRSISSISAVRVLTAYYIDQNAYTYINNLSTSNTLSAKNIFATNNITISSTGSGDALFIIQNQNNTKPFVVDSNGNVSIKTNDVIADLTIAGNTSASGDLTASNVFVLDKIGLRTNTPNETLTVNGNISSNSVIYDKIGNSIDWNSVYSTWNSTSALELTSRTIVRDNSANWSSVYSDWNSVSAFDLRARTFVGNNSADILAIPTTYLKSAGGVITSNLNISGAVEIGSNLVLRGALTAYGPIVNVNPTLIQQSATSLVIDTSASIGQKLTVGGEIITNNLFVTNNAVVTGTIVSNASITAPIIYGGSGNSNNWNSVYSNSPNYILDGGNTRSNSITIGTNDNFDLNLETNGTPRMTILNSGNVGIGTSSPGYFLDVHTDSDIWHVKIGGNTGLLRIGGQTASGAVIQSFNPTTSVVRDLYLQRDGGNVGIGTANPTAKLDVAGSVAVNYLHVNAQDGASEGGEIQLKGAGSYGNLNIDNFTGNLRVHTLGASNYFEIIGGSSSSPALRIHTGGAAIMGSVGIGTSSPSTKLHVSSTDSSAVTIENPNVATTNAGVADNFTLFKNHYGNTQISNWQNVGMRIGSRTTANGGTGQIVFTTGNDAETMRLTSTGLGIGTTTPAERLTLNGAINTNRLIQFSESDTARAYVGLGTDNVMRVKTTNTASIRLATNNVDRLFVDGSGNVGIGVSPATNARLHISGGGLNIAAAGDTSSLDASLHIKTAVANDRMTQIQPSVASKPALNLMASTDSSNNFQWWSWGVNSDVWTIQPNTVFSSGNIGLTINRAGFTQIRGTGLGTTFGNVSDLFELYNGNGNANYLKIFQYRHGNGSSWETASTKIMNLTDSNAQAYIEFNPTGNQWGMAFGTGGTTERMRIVSDGRVGIGTTNPYGRLTVMGGGNNTNNYNSYGSDQARDGLLFNAYHLGQPNSWRRVCDIVAGGENAGSEIRFLTSNFSSYTATQKMIISHDGLVGIGSSYPSVKLDVNDNTNSNLYILSRNINAGNAAHAGIAIGNDTNWNKFIIFTNSSTKTTDGGAGNTTMRTDSGKLLLGAGGTTYHALDTNGFVGIGTTTPGYNLHVNGTVFGSHKGLLYGDVGTSYVNAFQIREAALNNAGNTSDSYRPRLGFHWAGLVASSISLRADGAFSFDDNPGTGRANIYAGSVVANLVGNAGTATSLSTNRTNWSTNGTISNVVGQLAWKNYGNNHTIFDASQGTAPDGSTISNTNPSNSWSGSYPTLMGWNGSITYGVRVDSARAADTATSAGTANRLATDGTTNVIPKWGSSAGTLTNSLMSDNGSAVGIGGIPTYQGEKFNVTGGGIAFNIAGGYGALLRAGRNSFESPNLFVDIPLNNGGPDGRYGMFFVCVSSDYYSLNINTSVTVTTTRVSSRLVVTTIGDNGLIRINGGTAALEVSVDGYNSAASNSIGYGSIIIINDLPYLRLYGHTTANTGTLRYFSGLYYTVYGYTGTFV